MTIKEIIQIIKDNMRTEGFRPSVRRSWENEDGINVASTDGKLQAFYCKDSGTLTISREGFSDKVLANV